MLNEVMEISKEFSFFVGGGAFKADKVAKPTLSLQVI
jgi:hypothetical protein